VGWDETRFSIGWVEGLNVKSDQGWIEVVGGVFDVVFNSVLHHCFVITETISEIQISVRLGLLLCV